MKVFREGFTGVQIREKRENQSHCVREKYEKIPHEAKKEKSLICQGSAEFHRNKTVA
jgi:hypothetical protein